MKKAMGSLFFNKLRDQYIYQGLPVDDIEEKAEFTIHNLLNVHDIIPFKSPVYRTNYFSFVFVKDGRGKYTTDNHSFNSHPGMIYFTNPGHYKSYEWHEIKEVYLITLSESFLKENVEANIFEKFSFLLAETIPPRILDPAIFSEFEQLYLQIHKEHLSASPYREKMIGNLFVVLLYKIKEYFWNDYNPIDEGNRSSHIVKDFKNELEKHYRDLRNGKAKQIFRVQDYAAAQNLHPNYLSNVIKSKTGKSISAWTAEKTISEAKTLLLNSSISIKEIAYLLGFAESANFSSYFKKHADISPVLYRKNHRISAS